MIDDNNIQVAELCTLQFREPREYVMYPEQADMYCPKIGITKLIRVQVLVSEAIATADELYLRAYTDKGYLVASLEKQFTIAETAVDSGFFYADAILEVADLADVDEDTIAYFSIENLDKSTIYASSLWYKINPLYTGDLKYIDYAHGSNDWNVQFNSNTFRIWVECGYVPIDSRDEQETEDFVQQNMVNELTYGDEYEVIGLTFGGVEGIPNWLRKKISRASLCDTFEVNDEPITRIQGAKMEKVADTYSGLAIYKLDVQTTNNYLQ